MEQITIDGVDENDFRRSIEDMLRHGQADDAAAKLRELIAPYCGDGRTLPARFLSVSSADVSLPGWDQLAGRIRGYDRPEHTISAIGITMTGPTVDVGGLTPCVETSYYSDAAFPFSEAVRDDLLEGYSHYGCEWQGDFEHADSTISIAGLDDLFEAVTGLETRLLDSENPCSEEIRAGSLGACYLAVLVHQAVRDTIRKQGLPRALCVMAGNSGVYPFFDAPVMSRDECPDYSMARPALPEGTPSPDEDEDREVEGLAGKSSDYGSLTSLGSKKGQKKPVIVLDAVELAAAAEARELVVAQHMAEAGESLRAAFSIEPEELDAAATAAVTETELSHGGSSGFTDEDGGQAGYADDEWSADRSQAWLPGDTSHDPASLEEVVADPPAHDSRPPDNAPVEADLPGEEFDAPVAFDAVPSEHAENPPSSELDQGAEIGAAEDKASPRIAEDQPRGHSLRAQIASTSVVREGIGSRFLAAVRRLLARIGLG